LIREMILQLKVGWLDAAYFRVKFGVEIVDAFAAQWDDLTERGLGAIDGDRITLSPEGLLRVDSLLPAFFLPEHRGDRYV
jgi:oxygen-independent coproporphyrinogen-3 oxidase